MEGRWIEEGLYFCGPSPPGIGRPSDWVEIPHESYIPIAKARIEQALLAHPRGREAGLQLEHLLRLVDGLLHFHHHDTLNQLKQDYQLFSPDGGAAARDGLGEDELGWAERRFLGNFLKAVVLGNFTPLSDADYRRAVEQTYLLDVPVEIDWRRHDAEMLASFIAHTDADGGRPLREELGLDGTLARFLSLPDEVGTHALVFYRGIDRDQAQGRFLMQRLDLIVNRVIGVLTYPVLKPIQLIVEARRGKRAAPAGDGADPGPAARSTIFERRWLRRKNLRNQGLFERLFAVQRLQEPVLRQAIILFRLAPPPSKAADAPPRDPTIHLKMFRNIPLADSEIVFPEKIIRMGSFDLAMLIVSVAAAVPALIAVIARGGGASVALLAAMATLVAKTVGRYLGVRGKYLAKVTQNLYDKNLDNSVGVLQYLVDSLEEQEYKEAVLVYFVLWTEARPLTEAEIDAAAERFLATQFKGIEIDFEVDDALRKVVDRGADTPARALPIVELLEDGRYRARPLGEALRILDDRWDNLFHYYTAGAEQAAAR